MRPTTASGNGTMGEAEPPVPGTSNATVVMPTRLASSVRSGSHISMLPPRPISISRGRVLGLVPARTETRTRCPSARTVRTCADSEARVIASARRGGCDVAAGRGIEHRVFGIPGGVGRGDPRAGPLLRPPGPGLPPAALRAGCLLEPGVRVRARGPAEPVVRPGVARWVDQAGDVAGVAEHEGGVAADQLRGAVARLPRGQVVGDGAGDEGGH